MKNKLPYTNLLINSFVETHLSKTETELLKFLLLGEHSKEKANGIFGNVNSENLSDNMLLFIEYFCKLYPEIHLNKCLLQKIKVVADFYMKKRMELYVHLDKLSQKYNDINERPMLLKGAVFSYLNPNLLRTMSDIDILVSKNAYNNTPKFAKESGYSYCIEPHSYDLHEKNSTEGALDVHQYIYMDTKCEENLNKYLRARAENIKFLERDLCIPADEDIVFISLVNTARNIRNATSISNIFYSLFDLKFILNRNQEFNWNIVFDNAKITSTLIHLYFSMFFIKNIFPSLLPDNLLMLDEEMIKGLENYSVKVYYNRILIDDLRQKCRNIQLKNIFKDKFSFIEYLKIKPKYAFLKSVKNNIKIIKSIIKKAEETYDYL